MLTEDFFNLVYCESIDSGEGKYFNLDFSNNKLTTIPDYVIDKINGEGYHSGVLDFSNNNLTSIPENSEFTPGMFLNDMASLKLNGNNLCDEFKSFWINDEEWGTQNQSNCCEGVNDEGETVENWTTCP